MFSRILSVKMHPMRAGRVKSIRPAAIDGGLHPASTNRPRILLAKRTCSVSSPYRRILLLPDVVGLAQKGNDLRPYVIRKFSIGSFLSDEVCCTIATKYEMRPGQPLEVSGRVCSPRKRHYSNE